VEAGQALIVLLFVPLFVWMRGATWEPRFVRIASLAVALVGAVWVVERLFLA
jgi:hypothetical protein